MKNNQPISNFSTRFTCIAVFLFLGFMTNAQKHYEIDLKDDDQNTDNKDTYITKDGVEVYNVADEMPRFPGCEELESKTEKHDCANRKHLEYLYGNLRYPKEARKEGIQGLVLVRFYIDTLGIAQNIQIVRDIGGGAGEVVKQIYEQMNKDKIRWIPGRHNGKAVNVVYNMPVRFQLQSHNKD